MLDDKVITIRTNGLEAQDVLEKLGGIGRDKPVRAISIGTDLFAKETAVQKWLDQVFVKGHADDGDLEKLQRIVDSDDGGADV